jgi:ribonuclease kappa
MMGSEEDPTDSAAVAASVFGAVAIYGVCTALLRES